MPSISDLFGGGMPQRPQGTGMSMPPQGGMDPAMGGGGGLARMLQAPPGLEALNRPAGPDIMGLIQMLMQAVTGGGGGGQLPPLDQGQMQSIMQPPPPALAGMAQPAGPSVAPPLPAPPPKVARKPQPTSASRTSRPDESRAGKMGISTQKGKAKKNPPKGRSSYKERFASDIED